MNRWKKRAFRLIPPLLIGGSLAFSAPDERFHGGGYDGAAAEIYSSYTPPVGGQHGRFVGGGGYDGYGSAVFAGYTPPSGGQYGRFVGGGGYDGYGSAVFAGYTPPVGGQHGRFVGGSYDGHAQSAAEGQGNPLDGDSDSDGVPDWWESKHYLSLTLADAHTDIDADGGGSFYEWVADTDPNDPLSKLTLLAFRRSAQIEIDFGITSVNRRYWIEASTSAMHGDWSPATDPPVVGIGGDMSLTTPATFGPDALFRIRVAVPD